MILAAGSGSFTKSRSFRMPAEAENPLVLRRIRILFSRTEMPEYFTRCPTRTPLYPIIRKNKSSVVSLISVSRGFTNVVLLFSDLYAIAIVSTPCQVHDNSRRKNADNHSLLCSNELTRFGNTDDYFYIFF